MLTAPARVEPKISPKAGAAELGRERLARLNGCHNLILSNTTFRKPLQGMWVQPNHMPVETPAGGDSSSGRANRKRNRGEATGRACLPLPRSRAFWLWTKAEKALAHGRDRGIPRPLPKESAKAMRADAGGEGSGAASRRSAARCAYAKLCLDCSKGKALGLASSRVQQPHESLVAAR